MSILIKSEKHSRIKHIYSTKNIEKIGVALILLGFFSIFLFFIWYISDIVRAKQLDSRILYSVDDIFRYCYLRNSINNPLIFLNPNVKPLSMLIARLFSVLIPIGMASMRVMNSLFSIGALLILYKLARNVGFNHKYAIIAILLTFSCGIYFLASISTLAEIMFCFFLLYSVLLLHHNRYFSSAIFVSFLPTIRQEGILYLCIWAIILYRKSEYKLLPVLLFPTSIWILLTSLFLKYSIAYNFLYMFYTQRQSPSISLTSLSQITFFSFLFLVPILGLFLTGLFTNLLNKKNRIIIICVFVHLGFFIGINIFQYVTTGTLVRDLRLILPAVPFIYLYIADSFRIIVIKFPKKIIEYILIILTVILNITQIKQLQNDRRVKDDFVTAEEENILKSSSSWLNDFLEKEKIKNVYVWGSSFTNKFTRRLWLYLIPDVIYATFGKNCILDLVTFRCNSVPQEKAVFISIKKKDSIGIFHRDFSLLYSCPSLELYFYLIREK